MSNRSLNVTKSLEDNKGCRAQLSVQTEVLLAFASMPLWWQEHALKTRCEAKAMGEHLATHARSEWIATKSFKYDVRDGACICVRGDVLRTLLAQPRCGTKGSTPFSNTIEWRAWRWAQLPKLADALMRYVQTLLQGTRFTTALTSACKGQSLF